MVHYNEKKIGWVVISKPEGISSAFVTNRMKKFFPKGTKIGHAGTLDPFAEGVLPVAIGACTRFIPFLMQLPKVYRFTVQWGAQTDTDDKTGKIIAEKEVYPIADHIQEKIKLFTGEIQQVPCTYSAAKIEGKRAYQKARDLEDFTLAARTIHIYNLTLLAAHEKAADFQVECSTGTYVRALARDMAIALGTVGHLTFLCRERVGPFGLHDSADIDIFKRKDYKEGIEMRLFRPDYGLENILPKHTVDLVERDRLWCGQPIHFSSHLMSDVWICECEGEIVALCRQSADELLPYRCFLNNTVGQ